MSDQNVWSLVPSQSLNLSQTGMPGGSLGFCFGLMLRQMAQFGMLFLSEGEPGTHEVIWLDLCSS